MVDFFKDLDPEEYEHIVPFFTLSKDAYIAIYEYPKMEGDLPVYVRTGPNTW